jgi:hypothetical protein
VGVEFVLSTLPNWPTCSPASRVYREVEKDGTVRFYTYVCGSEPLRLPQAHPEVRSVELLLNLDAEPIDKAAMKVQEKLGVCIMLPPLFYFCF